MENALLFVGDSLTLGYAPAQTAFVQLSFNDICCGTDKQDFHKSMQRVLELVRQAVPDIMLISILPVELTPYAKDPDRFPPPPEKYRAFEKLPLDALRARVDEFNAGLEALAARTGMFFFDVAAQIRGYAHDSPIAYASLFQADGVHYTDRGYRQLAAQVAAFTLARFKQHGQDSRFQL